MDGPAQAIEDSLRNDDIQVSPDEHKLAELLLLAAAELAEDPFGGAVKTNKVMFFAEFIHMRKTGRPITGAAYQRLPWGPAPRRLLPVRDRLIRSGAALLTVEIVAGREQHRIRAQRAPQKELFSQSERQAVAEAVSLLKGRTGQAASDLSPTEPGWLMVAEGETIPFVTAFLAPDQRMTSPRIKARAAQIAEEFAQRAAREG